MRLLAAIRTDVLLQARNQLYAISVGVSVLVGGILAWWSSPAGVGTAVPAALLMFVGGSTFLYVVAMIILEKDDGTLHAVAVSPLRPEEYLAAKVVTLSGIATLEGVLICGGALALLSREGTLQWPGPLLLVGLVALATMHVLAGIVLVVRYERIMETIIPMGLVATILQIPALYFLGALDHPATLLIPTTAATMLIRASFSGLEPWEWWYAITTTVVVLAGLAVWARGAYARHARERLS